MRKKSLSDIQKKYKLSGEDRKAIASAATAMGMKESVAMLKESAQSLTDVAKSLEKSNGNNVDNIEKILTVNLTTIRKILDDIGQRKKEWRFSVERNKSGFISGVVVKQIK